MPLRINPSNDIISGAFAETFARIPEDDENMSDDMTGLLFTQGEILETSHTLAQLLRYIFVTRKVTIQEFDMRYREYAVKSLNIQPSQMSTAKGNLLRAIKRPIISFNKFVETLILVMGFDMNFLITLTDLSGKTETIDHHSVINNLVNEAK